MKTCHMVGIVLILCVAPLCLPASSVAAVSPTEAYLVQLQLPREQAVAASRIVRGMEEGLRVPLYDYTQLPDGGIFGISPVWVPVEQALAVRTQQMQAEIASRNPDSALMQRYAGDLVNTRQYAQATIHAGVTALATVLSPQQIAGLPLWPRVQHIALLTSPPATVVIAAR